MNYNSTSDGNGLCQEIDSLCGTNSTTYPLIDKLRRLNSGLDDYFHISMKTCGNWSVEDSGRTDFAIATTDLLANQTNYSFPSELLILDRVETLDTAGNWTLLEPIIEKEVGYALGEYQDTAGIPNSYRKVGNAIFIYPVQASNVTAGLKIYYRRAFTYATQSAGTFTPTAPTIPSVHHTWLALTASLPYLISKGLSQKNDVAAERERLTKQIEEYYTGREKDRALKITGKYRTAR